MLYVRKTTTLAILGLMAAIAFPQTSEGQYGELVGNDQELARYNQQGSRHGWVPANTDTDPYGTERFEDAEPAPDGYREAVSERADERESLRRAYRATYAGKGQTLKAAIANNDECECGEGCICPPLVCKDKACKMNYVFVVSAPAWCAPCKRMHPTVLELREEGYKVFYYDVDKFEDLDARFDVTAYPTFIVFDNGKEVARAEGMVSKKWFTDRLETIEDQRNKPDPEPEPDPDNPYDILVDK